MNLSRIKKILIGLTAVLALSATLIGCGKVDTPATSEQTQVDITDTEDNSADVVDSTENTDAYVYEYNSETGREFRGVYTGIEVTGIEEFDSIKTDLYEDIPSDGNVFVVIYMDLVNFLDNPYYFNPDECAFTVDGQNADIKFIVNDPKDDYKSIFGYVEQDATGYYYDRRGFVAIEAPANWQELQFKYTGWQYEDYGTAIIINNFTRADLESTK